MYILAVEPRAMRAIAPQLDRLRAAIDDNAAVSGGVPPIVSDSPRTELSEREPEIVDIAARGLTNVEIDQCLALTEPAAKWHVQEAFHELGAA